MADDTMTSTAKYLFDRSFAPEDIAAEEKARVKQACAPTYSEEELEAAREQARSEGHQAGLAQARTEIEQIVANTLTSVDGSIASLIGRYEQDFADVRRDAAEMAVAVARKLAPALIARQPAAEVEALVTECLADLRDEPRVVVRASELVVDALKPRIENIAAGNAFPGRVILLPDDNLQGADCRVEWADGGVEREIEALDRRIDEAVSRFVRSGTVRSADEAAASAPTPDPESPVPEKTEDTAGMTGNQQE
jgi:flagellar assembly protein FliH